MNCVNYIGLDVDDQAFHACVFSSRTGELREFKTKANASNLLKSLKKEIPDLIKTSLFAYEAGHLGFSLMRDLRKRGITCKVIAPTSIPKSPNERVKNDRLDSRKLAMHMHNNALTFVEPPSEEEEADRQLVRTRSDLVTQASGVKRKILSLCRTLGIDYAQETGKASNWTNHHHQFIQKKIKELKPSAAFALDTKLKLLEYLRCAIADLEHEIEKLAESTTYKKSVNALKW